jgi:hypothetical protein
MGVEAAIDANNKALEPVDALAVKIRETPAKTFAGIAVKARAVRFDAALDMRGDDWQVQILDEFIAELDRLAKAEAMGS